MGGHNENRVRQALLTVRDANVLGEMAAGWRASIGQLNEADDKIRRGIRGLRDGNQFGDATRDAAIDAFREMRDYIEVQRDKLAQTARALDAASGALSQAASTVSRWNMVGDPVAPGAAPVADPAATDQAPYLAAVTLHGQQTAGYNQAVASREEEARQVMESLERVFNRSEDKIREQHGIPREENPEPKPKYPRDDWPGEPPTQPPPGDWPKLPVFPPVDVDDPKDPETPVDPKRPEGPKHVPGVPPTSGHPQPPGVIHASMPDSSHPSTSVAGSSQSGAAYQGSAGGGAPGSFSGAMTGSAPAAGSAGMAGLAGALSTTAGGAASAAGAARAGGAGSGAGRMGGAGAGGAAGRAGSSRGASGRAASGAAGAGRSGPGGKGSQKASGTAKTAQSGRGSSAGVAGGRGGRKKDQKRGQSDVFTTEDHWLDGEETAPEVLR